MIANTYKTLQKISAKKNKKKRIPHKIKMDIFFLSKIFFHELFFFEKSEKNGFTALRFGF